MADGNATPDRAAKWERFAGYDENGVWVNAYKDEHGNIVGCPPARVLDHRQASGFADPRER